MKLELCKYSESVASALRRAMGSDIQYIEDEIASGVCQLWRFSLEDALLGYAVTRQEADTYVIVCYEGSHVQDFAHYVRRVCDYKKIPYARFHTTRPGLIKMLASLNPEPLEYVVRVECYGR